MLFLPAAAGGFCVAPRGGLGVRPVPGRGEVRRRPLACGSAAGQIPLSLFGCAEKRKRFLMVSREKTLAEAFQAPPEMPFPAFYGGYLDADLSAWITQPRMAVSEAGGGSGCTAVLFCCRTSAVAGDWWIGHSGYPLLLSELPVPHSPDAALRPRNVGRSGAAFPAVPPSPAA